MKGNIFIKRPVMAISISIVILLVGFISLISLPVEQFEDIVIRSNDDGSVLRLKDIAKVELGR